MSGKRARTDEGREEGSSRRRLAEDLPVLAVAAASSASTDVPTQPIASSSSPLHPAAAPGVDGPSQISIGQLPAELLARILLFAGLEPAWQLRSVCRAWRAAVENVPWTLEGRFHAKRKGFEFDGEYDVSELELLAALVRAGKLRLQALGLTLACIHEHQHQRCSIVDADRERRALVQRSYELLEACSARGLTLTDVSVVLLYTCGADPLTADLVHTFVERTLQTLGGGPGAASLRHLTVDAVPLPSKHVDDMKEACDHLVISCDCGDTWPFNSWPADRVWDLASPRWRPSAADLTRLLGPFRSLRRLSLAPSGILVSPPAAAALAAALPDLRALRLCPLSEESVAALAPLPLELFHLGAEERNRRSDPGSTRSLGTFSVGECLARLAEGRAGECLRSLYLEWSVILPVGLRALARIPNLVEVNWIKVLPDPRVPDALACLRESSRLSELQVWVTTCVEVEGQGPSAPEEVAATLRSLADVVAAPTMETLVFLLSGPKIPPDAPVVLLEACVSRGSLSELDLNLWDRALTKREAVAVVSAARSAAALTAWIYCNPKSYADVNHLKVLRDVPMSTCGLSVKPRISPGAFSSIAPAGRGGARGTLANFGKLRRMVLRDLRRALPGVEVDVTLED